MSFLNKLLGKKPAPETIAEIPLTGNYSLVVRSAHDPEGFDDISRAHGVFLKIGTSNEVGVSGNYEAAKHFVHSKGIDGERLKPDGTIALRRIDTAGDMQEVVEFLQAVGVDTPPGLVNSVLGVIHQDIDKHESPEHKGPIR